MIRKTTLIISSLWLLTLYGCGNNASLEVETQVIDGIPHILNPAQPLKGRVLLEIEKIREINLKKAQFYEFGFALIETDKDDNQIYREYKITNLPEIFEK